MLDYSIREKAKMPTSSEEAISQGLNHYYSGKLCRNGHRGKRNLRGQCISCRKENARKRLDTPSRMLDIDHLIEQRKEESLMDKYYDMEL